MEHKNRLYLNVIKGIAAFLMLWGHCIQYCGMGEVQFFGDPTFEVIYSFHMPLFMLVSGYLFYFSFCKRDLKTLLAHRMQSMLQPIVFGTILNNILMKVKYLILSGDFSLFDGSLYTGMNLLWFLWCVLSSSIAVAVACKVTDNRLLQAVLLVVGGVFVATFPEKDYHLYMYPFFVAGFFWAKYKDCLTRLVSKVKYVILLVYPLMMRHFNWTHFIYSISDYKEWMSMGEQVRVGLFRYLIGFAGSAFVLVLVELLFKVTVEKGKVPKLLKAVSKLGENSLQIYCLSAPLLSGWLSVLFEKLMEPVGYNIFAKSWVIYDLFLTLLVALLYAVGLYFLVWLMKKCKLHKIIFGR